MYTTVADWKSPMPRLRLNIEAPRQSTNGLTSMILNMTLAQMHHHQEVLQYLANSRMGAPAPKAGGVNQGEHFKMSEGTSEHVNLLAFLMVPHGIAPDPAKKVHSSYPYGIYDA